MTWYDAARDAPADDAPDEYGAMAEDFVDDVFDDELTEKPRLTVARFLLLMAILVMLAAVFVWVLLPVIEVTINPLPTPTLNPPDMI